MSGVGSSGNAAAPPDPSDSRLTRCSHRKRWPRTGARPLACDTVTELDEHGGWPALLTALLDRQDLSAAQARAAMATILDGQATPAQLIGFVVALRAKGETPEELSGLLDGETFHQPEVVIQRDTYTAKEAG